MKLKYELVGLTCAAVAQAEAQCFVLLGKLYADIGMALVKQLASRYYKRHSLVLFSATNCQT